MTCRQIADHARLIQDADLAFPVILSSDGRVIDGMHRICKAHLMGFDRVEAVRFQHDPEPDHIGVHPNDLPYEDARRSSAEPESVFPSLLRTVPRPELLDVAVGHAGDVVGHGASEPFGWNLGMVVGGQQFGVGDQNFEQLANHLSSALVFFFHSRGVVEVCVEIAFGGYAIGFHGWTEGCDSCGCAADVVERSGAEIGYAMPHLFDQIGDEAVKHAVERFIHYLLGGREGELSRDVVVEAAEERDMAANIRDVQDAGVEAIIKICCKVGNLVGEVDQLRLEGRAKIEEVFGELGMGSARVIAGVLDDAFADAEGEIESAPCRIALFKPGDDPQGVQVVVETEAVPAQCGVEGLFASVAKGRMADVVGEGEGFSELAVQTKGCGESAGDLCDFEGVREAATEMVAREIARQTREDLGFPRKAAKGTGVENAGAVAREGRAIRMGPLGMYAGREGAVAIDSDGAGQRVIEVCL
jgi:hypothetical protein